MRNKLSLLIVLIIAITGNLNIAKAQDTVVNAFVKGRLDSLNSGILNQKRLIQVFTPTNYKPGSTDKYDVLYVLDGGNWNTGLIKEIQRLLEGDAFMPPTIIVSVLNVDRNKDFLPTHTDDIATSGGADKFLGFIKNELIPYVNKAYPSNGDNTLWGHSFGGLFVMYALLNEPNTFKSYIAVDPSFWWDKGNLLNVAGNKLPAISGVNPTLFISGREGTGAKEMKIDTMETILKKLAPANLTWKVVLYPNETHSSVRFKSMYDGLKFTYDGFGGGVEFHPTNGIIAKNQPIKIWYFANPSKVYYTLDGTEPVLTSAKMTPEITLSGPAQLKAKAITNRSRYDSSGEGVFKEGVTMPAVAKYKNAKQGGFNYSYYEVEGDALPDFKKLKPNKTGVVNKDFDINKFPRKDKFALLIDGQLETKEDGYYAFFLGTDNQSKLYLGNQLLIKRDSLNKKGVSYILPLAKGFYPFRLEYVHKTGNRDLTVIYVTPSNFKTQNATPIPLELQYSK